MNKTAKSIGGSYVVRNRAHPLIDGATVTLVRRIGGKLGRMAVVERHGYTHVVEMASLKRVSG